METHFQTRRLLQGMGSLGFSTLPSPPLHSFSVDGTETQKLEEWGLARMVVPTPLWATSGPRG